MKTIQNKLLTTLSAVLFLLSACSSTTATMHSAEQPAIATTTLNLPTAITKEQEPASPQQKPDEKPTKRDTLLKAELSPVAGEYFFTEGPVADSKGNVYFSDINAGKIYMWSPNGSVTVFLDELNRPNGLSFDKNDQLVACEGGSGRLISIDPQGGISVLADQYNGIRFNEPNDLWIDPQGGIYFTDPAYQSPVVQDGEHVYYLSSDRSQLTRVIDDMVRPNGIVDSEDGTKLYVADHGAGQTFAYDINSDGTLSNRRLFVATGSDGMTLDNEGNLYLTTPNQVQIYDASGVYLKDIPTPENPTNVTLIGADKQTLFITARTAVYTFQVFNKARGSAVASNTGGFTLTSPDVVEGGALPSEYTCDGASRTLPLTWSGAPSGTQSFAIIMHHVAGADDIHWYWVLYDIPANITNLAKNSTGVGTLGTNHVNGKTGYSPPCSKGPGEKHLHRLCAVDPAAILCAVFSGQPGGVAGGHP